MKKYLTLIAICLIYYWPVEVPVLCLAGIGYYIAHRQHTPPPLPEQEHPATPATDYIQLYNGSIAEFHYHIHYHNID